MEPLQLTTLCIWAEGELHGTPVRSAEQLVVTRICTDSRALQPGDLFVPLKGENFNGHAFIERARSVGAIGSLAERAFELAPSESGSEFALIKVDDTLQALQKIAGCYRQTLPLKSIAITGSNGKTSTKDFTAAVLSERFEVVKTEGNFNNHIGLPLTLLSANRSHKVGVFELGMNHPGEIAPLARLAAPDLGIITNIGTAHIEFMGTRDAIAREKGSLAQALSANGVLILQADDDFTPSIAASSQARVVLTGIGIGDLQATDIRTDSPARLGFGTRFIIKSGAEEAEATLSVPGEHMVRNALLAVAAGMAMGMSLKECCSGLAKASLTKGRLERKTIRGIQFLDDSYNANPDSVVAAIRTLSQVPAIGRRIAMLGQMNELGTETESGHRRVGEAAAAEKIDCIVSVGNGAASIIAESARKAGAAEVFQVYSTEEAAGLLRQIAVEGDLVLLKGSRGVRMEKILEAFA